MDLRIGRRSESYMYRQMLFKTRECTAALSIVQD